MAVLNKNKLLSVKELLSQDFYSIPIYQRNFAWENKELLQLIQDINDSSKFHHSGNYYIGTLVTFPREQDSNTYYEVIDGQQRLTALTVILCAIKNEISNDLTDIKQTNLRFAFREKSNSTLDLIFNNKADALPATDCGTGAQSDGDKGAKTFISKFPKTELSSCVPREANPGEDLGTIGSSHPQKSVTNYKNKILDAYRTVSREILKIWSTKESDEESNEKGKLFIDYLLNKVFILRTVLPSDTDLAHYFVTMNSRVLPLEAHEVVKAKLLGGLTAEKEERKAFHKIWEACAEMDRYLPEALGNAASQLPLAKDVQGQREEDKNLSELIASCSIQNKSLDNSFYEDKSEQTDSGEGERSLKVLLEDADKNPDVPYPKPWEKSKKNDSAESECREERFASIINFPNFLLLVLKIMRPYDSEVVLDDKRLIQVFSQVYDKERDKGFSKNFALHLLYLRFLFDKFIIKSEKGKWSLQKLEASKYKSTFSDEEQRQWWDSPNKRIIMLLSMFQVSAPTQTHKNWLFAALRYLKDNPTSDAESYENFLWNLAKAYMLDWYLASDDADIDQNNKPISFNEIILKNHCRSVGEISKIKWSNINIDIDDNCQSGQKIPNFVFNFFDYLFWKKCVEDWKAEHKKGRTSSLDWKNFSFKYRFSVEHFYPQNPSSTNNALVQHSLQSFGNLALVTNSTNSRFLNLMPHEKSNAYGSTEKELREYSLKLQDMISKAKNSGEWGAVRIKEEEDHAKMLLQRELVKASPWQEMDGSTM